MLTVRISLPYFAVGPERIRRAPPGRSATKTQKAMYMEFLNRIQLRGVVGKAEVTSFPNDSRVCNFSVVTEYAGVDKEGNSASEITWFNVSFWSREGSPLNLYDVQKGLWVEVTGRLRLRRYVSQTGEERVSPDVIARTVKILPREEERMHAQRDY